jgi:hypothetical protein
MAGPRLPPGPVLRECLFKVWVAVPTANRLILRSILPYVVLQANHCIGGAVLLRGVDLAGAAQQDGPQLAKPALSALRLVDPARRRGGVHLAPLAVEAMARRPIPPLPIQTCC